MTDEARKQLESMALALERAPRRAMFDDNNWADDVPASAGVYALWHVSSGAMIYVGETASLRHRMRDLGRSVNHTCRRKLAVAHKLVDATETQLSAMIEANYVLSFLPVSLGRIELEEYLSLRYRKSIVNSPGRRLLTGTAYSWVTPA
jgi:hypothetical protein